jgi:uncharacterized protein involved in exopolysaccharide biosynthesis
LAGINLGSGSGNNKIAVALEVLRSRDFLNSFIERHHILPELMAVKGWDVKNNKIIYDEDLYDPESKKWVRVVDFPRRSEPSSWEAYKAFKEILTVSQAKETGFVTVAIEHQSPFLARDWVEMLMKDINNVMKSRDMTEAKRSIEFLQSQLAGVSVADMRTVFYQLIEEQMKTMMLAEIRDEYIFSTIDPPVVAEERASPNRVLICVLGLLLGGMLGVALALGRHFVEK